MHGQRHRVRIGCDGADFRPWIAAGQGQEGVDLDIQRKGERLVSQRRAAVAVDGEIALAGIGELAGRADRVAGQEAGEVDQHALAILGDDVGAPDDRAGEGLPGGTGFVGAGAQRAVAGVFELGEDAVIDAEEAQDLRRCAQPSVETDRIGTQTGCQAGGVDHAAQGTVFLLGELGEDAAVAGVDMQREEAVAALKPVGFLRPVLGEGRRGHGEGERAASGAPKANGFHDLEVS